MNLLDLDLREHYTPKDWELHNKLMEQIAEQMHKNTLKCKNCSQPTPIKTNACVQN